MDILLFSKMKNDSVERFCQEIERLKETALMRIDKYASFKRLLIESSVEQLPVIFMANGNKDLDFAITLKNYLIQTRLIMILPDKKNNIVSKALSLSPRLLLFSNNDVQSIIALLDRMASEKPYKKIA